MSPSERRYRRLLRLSPADHRAARGEELLGLDPGRAWPSSRQAVGVFGLALRLRLRSKASLLLVTAAVALLGSPLPHPSCSGGNQPTS